MTPCKHDETEFIGEQKTDNGVNTYLRCRSCAALLVVTPERKVFALESASRAS
jgi:hypothetical protein